MASFSAFGYKSSDKSMSVKDWANVAGVETKKSSPVDYTAANVRAEANVVQIVDTMNRFSNSTSDPSKAAVSQEALHVLETLAETTKGSRLVISSSASRNIENIENNEITHTSAPVPRP